MFGGWLSMLGEGVVSDGLIDPSSIPGKTIDVAGIETSATDLVTAAAAVATAGGSVVTGWSSLPAVYVAPEAQQLYDVMSPVSADTAALETTLTAAASAIATLATEVQDILSKLDTIRADASEFVVEACKGYTVDFWDPNHPNWDNGWFEGLKTDFADMKSAHIRWDQYDPAVERNKELIALVDAQVIALSEAEATCVDAINALRDDTCLPTSTPLTQQDLDAAGDRPWGDPDARYRSCYEATNDTIEWGVTSFASGFGRAAADTVVGFATLFGIDTDALGADPAGYLAAQVGYDTQTGEWSEELRDASAAAVTELSNRTLGEAAASLGAIALIGPVVPLLATTTGPVGDAAKAVWQKQQDVVLGIVGTPEQWQDNPAEAAGALTFNIGSAFVPVAGVAGKAGTVARSALGDAGDLARTTISETSTLAHKATNATKSGLDALLHSHRTPSAPHTVPRETGATTPTRVGVTTGTVDELKGRLPAAHPNSGNGTSATGDTSHTRDGGGANPQSPAADNHPTTQAPPAQDLPGDTIVDTAESAPRPGDSTTHQSDTTSDLPASHPGDRPSTPGDALPIDRSDPKGPGWERIHDTAEANPEAGNGDPFPQHGHSGPYPTRDTNDPAKDATWERIEDTDAPYGRDIRTGDPLKDYEYDERYMQPNGWYRYPDFNGIAPGTHVKYSDPVAYIRDFGPHLDRIGPTNGKYFGAFDDGQPASFEARALPVQSLNEPYHQYKFTEHAGDMMARDGIRIDVSRVAPGFGRPGGASQIRLWDPRANDSAGGWMSPEDAIDKEYLSE